MRWSQTPPTRPPRPATTSADSASPSSPQLLSHFSQPLFRPQVRQEADLARAAGPHPNILPVSAVFEDAHHHLCLAQARTPPHPP